MDVNEHERFQFDTLKVTEQCFLLLIYISHSQSGR